MKSSDQRRVVILATLVAVIGVVKAMILAAIYGFAASTDTDTYLWPQWTALRSLPYPLMMAITNVAQTPWVLIGLQIVLGAIALWVIIYTIGKIHWGLAIVLGILLSLDLNWTFSNLQLLTEGPTITFLVLSFACLLNHWQRRKIVKGWELIVAGMLYTWTVTMRPSLIFMMFPLILVYLWLLRPLQRNAWLVLGIAVVVVPTLLVNVMLVQRVRLYGGGGLYVGWPLFQYHLYQPENGNTSLKLDQEVRKCYPNIDYNALDSSDDSNGVLWGQFIPCMTKNGLSFDDIGTLFMGSYVEAITKQPLRFAGDVVEANIYFLSYPASRQAHDLPVLAASGYCHTTMPIPCNMSLDTWTNHKTLIDSLKKPINLLTDVASVISQPSIIVAAVNKVITGQSDENLLISTITFILSFLLAAFAFFAAKGVSRFGVGSAILLLAYLSLSTSVGHVPLARYASVFEPFYAYITAVSVIAALERFRKPAIQPAGSTETVAT